MNFSRIDRRPVTITITATNADTTAATIAAIQVALLPVDRKPTAATTWKAVEYAGGKAEVLLAGPDADPTGALVIPTSGARLWIKDPAVDATQAVPAGRVSLL